MSRFVVGVVVERVQEAELLFAVEAESLEEARDQAFEEAKRKCRSRVLKDVMADQLCWETPTDEISVASVSDEDYSESEYEPDYDLTEDGS